MQKLYLSTLFMFSLLLSTAAQNDTLLWQDFQDETFFETVK